MEGIIIKQNPESEFYTPENCYIIEFFNRHDIKDISLARARVMPGQTTALHSLRGNTELYYILQGKGMMEVNGRNLGEVHVDDTVLIPADVSQRITNIGNADLIFLCINTPKFDKSCYVEL